MANQTLVQRIALDGGEDIRKELAALGKEGEAAFEALKVAATKTAAANTGINKFLADTKKGLKEVGEQAAKVKEAFGQVGEAARAVGERFLALVTGEAAVVAGLIELTKHSAEAADAVKKASQAAGLSVSDYGRLQFAFEQGDVSAEQFGVAMKKLNTNIAQAAKVGTESGAKLALANDEQAQASAASIKLLNEDVAAIAASTKAGAAAFQKDIQNKSAITTDSIKKMNADSLQATQGSTAALKKLADDQAKAANAAVLAQDKVAIGQEKANAGVGAGAKLFTELGIAVVGADGQIRPTAAIIGDIAEKFKAMPDGAVKSALAIQIFGKAGALLIPTLDEGRAGLSALSAEAEKLGLVLTDTQVQVGADFNDALKRLTRTIGGVKLQFGLLFAPAFTAGFDALTQLIADNREAFEAFGKSISDQVIPIIKDVFSVIEGKDGQVQNKNILAIRDTVLNLITAFEALQTIVTFVFKAISDAIDPIVDLFNQVFGTHFTSQQVIFTALLGELLGVFKLFGATVKAVDVSYGAFIKVFGESGPLIARISGVVAGALLAMGTAKAAIDDLFNAFDATIKSASKSGANAFSGAWATAVNDVVGFFNGLGNYVSKIGSFIVGLFGDKGKEIVAIFHDSLAAVLGFFIKLGDIVTKQIVPIIVNSVAKALGTLRDLAAKAIGLGGSTTATGTGSTIQTKAEGGPVFGAGTGTSDSILSWLSNGEFVLRAEAVKKYGLGFLHALNNARLPAGGFAMGGLASVGSHAMAGIPSFANGGSAGRALSLTIGGETFAGLFAPEDVAEKLSRFAVKKNVTRAGSKPSWYGGRA